ncbi:hypothetical protein [Actinopolyspora xinjiangensis]|uniref:hypothetical protein n=1 Tax=Actinopolyspora xinjiangensis TaxID=405564 RepID=UPI001113C006|nr:hypothetical protein [Actinopolyspora xinjiangensis]
MSDQAGAASAVPPAATLAVMQAIAATFLSIVLPAVYFFSVGSGEKEVRNMKSLRLSEIFVSALVVKINSVTEMSFRVVFSRKEGVTFVTLFVGLRSCSTSP